jgi:hypothetical protein
LAAKQSTIGILDAAVALQETTELERPEVDIPDSVVDLFQADVVAGTDGGDIDPVVFPTDAAVGADVTHLEAIRIFQRRYLARHKSQRRGVAVGGSFQVQRFMGTLLVKLLAESVELLSCQMGCRRTRRLGLQGQTTVEKRGG